MWGVQRRSFLVGGITGTALLGCRPWTRPRDAIERPGPHQLETLAAIAETFLPGGDGTPGARDVNALATIIDPAYGVNPYISEVVSDLDEWCQVEHGGQFFELTTEQRELALEQRMGLHDRFVQSVYLPVYEGILALTKLAFFGALSNKLGTNYAAFPGASRGYAAASAAGAYAAARTPKPIEPGIRSTIVIEGSGNITMARVSAMITTTDDLNATVQVVAPDGSKHDIAVSAADGDALIDDLALPFTGPAAGSWHLDVIAVKGGSGELQLWSLRLRTDLDEPS
ncbi:MAG: Gluconate 2-dehydrogenase subunit 3 [Myxococcales bacterium]|nr:Gluconate 2-dehydrogenase subunit 3 [Myxococcales bacterium]